MTTSIQSLGGKARAANMTPEERTAAARRAATKGARKLGKEGRRLRALKGVATRKARAEAADTLQIKGYLQAPCPMVFVTPADDLIITSSPGGKPLAIVDPTFEAGRKAGHRLADNFVNASVGGMFSAGAQQLETLGSAVGARGGAVNVAPNVCTAGGFHGADVTPICRCSYADPVVEVLKVEPAAKPRRPLPKAGTMSAKVLDVVRLKGPILLDAIEDWIVPAAPRFEVRNALSSLRSAGHVVSEPKPGSRREKLWRLA